MFTVLYKLSPGTCPVDVERVDRGGLEAASFAETVEQAHRPCVMVDL